MRSKFHIWTLTVACLVAGSAVISGAPGGVAITNSTADGNPPSGERLKFQMDTLVGDYGRVGKHNAKWDAPAKEALTDFAGILAAPTAATARQKEEMLIALKAAVAKGCDDPMIRYMQARFLGNSGEQTPVQTAAKLQDAAVVLEQSQYAAVRKHLAALRAAEALNIGQTKTPPEVHTWRKKALRYLKDSINERSMPVEEASVMTEDLLKAVKTNGRELEEFYKELEPVLFKNWSNEAQIYLIKGIYYLDFAWQARGTGYANTVTEEGWRLFAQRVVEAEKALDQAWKLNPRDGRTAKNMLRLELGQGKGRARMEIWFKRATDLNPNDYFPFQAKLNYLEPKWYGSEKEMLDFARECVAPGKWGAYAAPALVDAHDRLVRYLPPAQYNDYWKRPEVWQDVKKAFDKYLSAFPDDETRRQSYVVHAWRAEKWDEVNRHVPYLKHVDYQVFGGKKAFDEMVEYAKSEQRE